LMMSLWQRVPIKDSELQISSFVTVDTTTEATQVPKPTTRVHGPFHNALAIGLGILLGFGVLSFGAVDAWSSFTFEAGAAVIFLLWVAEQVASGKVTLSKNPLYLPAALFFVLILAQIALGISAYSYVTKYEALHYVAYGIVLLVAAESVRDESVRKRFALAMLAFGVAYAFFALVQEATPNGKIFWLHRPEFNGSIYGSYVNRNHYAGLMEMLVPVPLVLSMGHLLKGGQRTLAAFCAVLMGSTIFLSGSRGGMIAFALQIVLFAALTLMQRKNLRIAIALVSVCLLVLLFLFFIGRGQVLGRLRDLAPGTRLNMTLDCLKMFSDRPIAGWGLGTFPIVYPKYRSFYTSLFINEAHDDYAQLLAEMGSVGFVLMIWFVVCLYRYRWARSRRWEFKWDGALSLSALLGCSGILFHSFVDFNLQIPANAAVFYALCGMATCNREKAGTNTTAPKTTSKSETFGA
jgi:O-antigen ligase